MNANAPRPKSEQPIEDAGIAGTSLERLVASQSFERFSTAVILVNALTMGAATYGRALDSLSGTIGVDVLSALQQVDTVALAWFVLEVALRMGAQGSKFYRDGWNIFDISIIVLSLASESAMLSALRVLRVLRALRLLNRFKSLRLIMAVMWQSISGSFAIGLIMLLVLYVFAIVGHQLFADSHPDLFGNLHLATYTLFRVAALFAYESVAEQMNDVGNAVHYFLMPYFLLMSFVIINFFTAIVVNYVYEVGGEDLPEGESAEPAAQDHEVPTARDTAALHEAMTAELRALRDEVAQLRNAR